jgi:hypothetical protein
MNRKLTSTEAAFLPLGILVVAVLYGMACADQMKDEEKQLRIEARMQRETGSRYAAEYRPRYDPEYQVDYSSRLDYSARPSYEACNGGKLWEK